MERIKKKLEVTFQIFRVLPQIYIPDPSDESLVCPDQRVGVDILTLVPPNREGLPVVLHYSQELDPVYDGSLVKLPRDAEIFLQFFFAEVLQDSGVHHVGSECFGILR